MISTTDIAPLHRHAVRHGVSWDEYEQVLKEIGTRDIRVTYLDGEMEIMSPLPQHENEKKAIGRLVEDLTFERGLPVAAFGATTFRDPGHKGGLEPDECFYIQNEARVRGMKRWDSKVHPPPDLAIEIDLSSRSIPKEPIYARLGVPEIWRQSAKGLKVFLRQDNNTYRESPRSAIFSFLPMDQFATFVQRMLTEERNAVVREFREWVRSLARS